jgi:predicted lipoprotein
LAAAFGLLACKKKEDDNKLASYNRQALLEHYHTQLIVPAFTNLDLALANLETSTIRFTQNASLASLTEARESLDSAFKAYQYVQSFEFGPADLPEGKFGEEVATFPVDTTTLENFVANNDTLFNNFRRDTRGLNAVDYLLWGKNKNSLALIAGYTNADGLKRKAYLRSVVRKMQQQTAKVKADWVAGKQAFITASGTEAGSSMANLFNQFNLAYEGLKNFKLGLPLGLRAGQAQAEPTKVEAYFSGKSNSYLLRHFQHTLQVWEGMGLNGVDGPGFREYLLAAGENGARLVADTEVQVNKSIEAGNQIPVNTPLSDLIVGNDQRVRNFFNELMKTTRFFKSEIASLTGIAISYSSGDGD